MGSAYCLLVLGGNANPTEADLTKAMKAAGAEVNADNVKAVCTALKGKELHEVVAAGYGKIASLSLGGGSSQQNAAQPAGGNKQEEKKEEKAAEPEEESEDYDVGDLF